MELLTRNRLMDFASIVMRVPPLFIIDKLLKDGIGVAEENIMLNETHVLKYGGSKNSIVGSLTTMVSEPTVTSFLSTDSFFYQPYVLITIKFIAWLHSIAGALYTFTLWTEHLLVFYMYLISVGTIIASYCANAAMIEEVIAYANSSSSGTNNIIGFEFSEIFVHPLGVIVVMNTILQIVLVGVFCCTHLAPRFYGINELLILNSFITSWAVLYLEVFEMPINLLHYLPVIVALFPLALCKFVLWSNLISILNVVDASYENAQNFISNHGLSALVELQWTRLDVPNVLRTFWILRIGEQAIQILGTYYGTERFCFYKMIRTLLVVGCETLTAVLGMTSIISLICHYIGCFFRWVLLTESHDEKSIGVMSAILFYILALQTGLTSLGREKRLFRLLKNFGLLSTAILHFIHNIVNPILMELSASYNPAFQRHLRALGVCIFLIVFPVGLMVFLWSNFNMSTWLLAVSIFSIEVIVKVLVSLAVYSLFLFDACRTTSWEPLDDCLYVIRSFGNIVDFTFGVILLFNGVWILVFEAGGAIRAVMMAIHAYYNIWHEAKAGWSLFMKRRTAVNKINSLSEANKEQLTRLNDVCAICYQEMKTAKRTKCNHFFHCVCLRKWLYIQDRCPLCHDILYKFETNEKNHDTNDVLDDRRQNVVDESDDD